VGLRSDRPLEAKGNAELSDDVVENGVDALETTREGRKES
jgi:hypothetical protein